MAETAKTGSARPIGRLSQERPPKAAGRTGRPLESSRGLGSLDIGIADIVHALRACGVETYESCEGGPGHAFPEPTVRFHGPFADGFRALAVALDAGLPVNALRRVWLMTLGEPDGPTWEMTFYPPE